MILQFHSLGFSKDARLAFRSIAWHILTGPSILTTIRAAQPFQRWPQQVEIKIYFML